MSVDLIAYLVLGFTIVERLFELIVSRRNEAWSLAHGGIEYGRSHYKWMVLMHTAFLVSMLFEFQNTENVIPDFVRSMAVLCALFCQILRWWIIHTLGRQWNTRVIVVPNMMRITRGPYRFLNHPNYVVVAVETFALPLIFGAWRTSLVFSLLNAIMMKVRIKVENEALQGLKVG